jgi:hypothetical protein
VEYIRETTDTEEVQMILTIEFTPRQEAWLAVQAVQQGVTPADIVKLLMDKRLLRATKGDETDPTLALFVQWELEDANKTLEEIAAEEKLWQEFEQGINATRQAQGMREI